MGLLDVDIRPEHRGMVRTDVAVYGVLGLLAVGFAVWGAVSGVADWWIALLSGVIILGSVAIQRRWLRTSPRR